MDTAAGTGAGSTVKHKDRAARLLFRVAVPPSQGNAEGSLCCAQVLLRAAKSTPMASSGGGALSYLANEASYDEDEVETARERIAALAARVEGRPLSPMARRMAAVKGYAIGLFEIVLALIYKVRA